MVFKINLYLKQIAQFCPVGFKSRSLFSTENRYFGLSVRAVLQDVRDAIARGFSCVVGLDCRLKKDPLVDTLCEKVVVEDSNERISSLSRDGEIPKERAGKPEGALRTVRRVERSGRTSVAFDMDRR